MFFIQLALVATTFMCVVGYPDHAQCEVKYKIPLSCAEVNEKIVNQMKSWNLDYSCPGSCEKLDGGRNVPPPVSTFLGDGSQCNTCPCGQKCLYDLGNTQDNVIKGTHTTPVQKFVDEISFSLNESQEAENECQVVGFSTAKLEYAYYDFSTNYCNLRNLMDGAGLSELQGYEEESSVDVCMQYDQINCLKY